MEIRKCTVGDAARLASLTEKTFRKTFGGSCSPQDMERYVGDDLTAEKFADELSREGSVFFAAEDNGNILGYIKINEGSEQTLSDMRAKKGRKSCGWACGNTTRTPKDFTGTGASVFSEVTIFSWGRTGRRTCS